MTPTQEVLVRKNELLQKKIQSMLMAENRDGLTSQDQFLKNNFIRELYSNNYQLNHAEA